MSILERLRLGWELSELHEAGVADVLEEKAYGVSARLPARCNPKPKPYSAVAKGPHRPAAQSGAPRLPGRLLRF